MAVVKNVSKEGEDFKNTEAAPLSRSESRGGDWKTQVSYNQYNESISRIPITYLYGNMYEDTRCYFHHTARI